MRGAFNKFPDFFVQAFKMAKNSVLNLEKMPCDENLIYCYGPETKRQSSQWKHAGSP